MNFLHPWFFVGLLAVAVPIVLHLARRRTRVTQPWSSLRFLRPSPPRLERKRRIEHWLLLLLRAGAVMLLAAAFARPFFTEALPGVTTATGVRQLLLIDVSASMRRAGLWDALLERARAHLRAAADSDRLAVMAFAGQTRSLVAFETWAATSPGGRAALVEAQLAALAPGWGATDLGAALVAAAEAVADDQASSAPMRRAQVILLSDVQRGARLGALGPADWPAGVELRIEPVVNDTGTNLGLQPVAQGGEPTSPSADGAAATPEKLRVKVVASAGDDTRPVTGRLRWSEGGATSVEVSVPAGQSRVFDAPARAAGAGGLPGTLRLEGDREDFDNQLFHAPAAAMRSTVVYIGDDDGKDAAGSLYFLSRAFPATRLRAPIVESHRPGDPGLPAALSRADLVVLTAAPAGALGKALRAHLAAGATVLFAPTRAEAVAQLGGLLAAGPAAGAAAWREAPAGREAVLSWVDLTHPGLSPFADGRSSDFTKIRFWKHRVLDPAAIAGARVLARFDDDSPAWLTVPVGQGLLFVMTSGWNLADSQLALSSKLVPLLWSLLEASTAAVGASGPLFVGDVINLPGARAAHPAGPRGQNPPTVRRPDGAQVLLPADSQRYAETDLPGLYQVTRGETSWSFAVNVPPGESATDPLPIEAFLRAGIPISEAGDQLASAKDGNADVTVSQRQREAAFFTELEARQKPWRWVLLLGLLLLLGEALLTVRASGRAMSAAGAMTAAPMAPMQPPGAP